MDSRYDTVRQSLDQADSHQYVVTGVKIMERARQPQTCSNTRNRLAIDKSQTIDLPFDSKLVVKVGKKGLDTVKQ